MNIRPHMSSGERVLLRSFLHCTKDYLEFGVGGSTIEALKHTKGLVHGVDCSVEWIDRVQQSGAKSADRLRLFHADIGPTKKWGMPLATESEMFRNYSVAIWDQVDVDRINFVLVDGRFRVSCFCEAAARARPHTFIAIHDYSLRGHYHAVEEVAAPLACRESLWIFAPREDMRERAGDLAEQFRNDPR